MVNPLCGYSLQKGARIIAIADLVVCIFGLSFRLIAYNLDEYETYEAEIELDESMSSLNDTNKLAANLTAQIISILQATGGQSDDYDLTYDQYYFAILIGKLVVAIIVFVGYIAIEVWLTRLLLRASKNRDGSACKTWFWWRIGMTIIFFVMTIVGIATLTHDWVDWSLEPLTFYRVYELFVINAFKNEIAATSGRVKLRA